MTNAFGLEGETALITGGGTGIGLGIARCMAVAGAKVVLVGRRETELRSAAESIGSAARWFSADVTHFDRAGEIVSGAAELAGSPVSILVNNAGNHLKKPAIETTPEDFEKVLRTHVLAAHALSAAVLPGMIERGHGSILFIASMASLFGVPLVSAYSAAKSAVVGMTRSLATEVARHGVRVNAIAPGWIESAMTRKALDADPDRKNRILSRTSMARLGEPDDIGHAAVYLCSPAGKYVTGTTLAVDGGASVGF